MMVEHRFAVLVRSGRYPERSRSLTLLQVAEICECPLPLAERLVNEGLLEPMSGFREPLLFDPVAVGRLRRAMRLKLDFGLNVSALSLVMELLDRIEDLEERLGSARRDDH